jgi:hypothetical protein
VGGYCDCGYEDQEPAEWENCAGCYRIFTPAADKYFDGRHYHYLCQECSTAVAEFIAGIPTRRRRVA